MRILGEVVAFVKEKTHGKWTLTETKVNVVRGIFFLSQYKIAKRQPTRKLNMPQSTAHKILGANLKF